MARPARPDQIARWGHIATAVRDAMAAKGTTVRELNEAIGVKANATQLYQILNCRNAPTETWAAHLHKLLGIPMAQLRERPLLEGIAAQVEAQAHARALPPPSRPVMGDVLQFAVNSEGNARVRLDVVLPVKEAMPLIRLLLDQGFILSGEED